MRGQTILRAWLRCYTTLSRENGQGAAREDRMMRQVDVFRNDLDWRLQVSDTTRKVWAADRGTPEQIINTLFGSSDDTDEFWSKLVARLRTDTAQIEGQKQKIAALEAQLHSAWGLDKP